MTSKGPVDSKQVLWRAVQFVRGPGSSNIFVGFTVGVELSDIWGWRGGWGEGRVGVGVVEDSNTGRAREESRRGEQRPCYCPPRNGRLCDFTFQFTLI